MGYLFNKGMMVSFKESFLKFNIPRNLFFLGWKVYIFNTKPILSITTLYIPRENGDKNYFNKSLIVFNFYLYLVLWKQDCPDRSRGKCVKDILEDEWIKILNVAEV